MSFHNDKERVCIGVKLRAYPLLNYFGQVLVGFDKLEQKNKPIACWSHLAIYGKYETLLWSIFVKVDDNSCKALTIFA